ncbi:MAG: hypothetical protein GPJ50_15605 [Candidatus Heimdallarchaeota archaeon]|nr:hypothetical protein [Candidatus Heimdallarchaeota archaeon]
MADIFPLEIRQLKLDDDYYFEVVESGDYVSLYNEGSTDPLIVFAIPQINKTIGWLRSALLQLEKLPVKQELKK